MRAHFNHLSLKARLSLGFGIVIALMALTELVALFGREETLRVVDSYFQHEDRVQSLASSSEIYLARARSTEKEFLLNARQYGPDHARAEYLGALTTELNAIRRNMKSIRALRAGAVVDRLASAVETSAMLYEGGILQAVDLRTRLGYGDSGARGRVYDATRQMTSAVLAGPHKGLVPAWLDVRYLSVQFVDGGATELLAQHERAVNAMLGARGLPKAELASYRKAFDDFVEIRHSIDSVTLGYREAERMIESSLLELNQLLAQKQAATRAAVQAQDSRAMWQILVASLAAILLGVLVARKLARNLRQAVAGGVQFAGALSAGDLSARLPVPRGGGELADLTVALNRMADRLQQGHGREMRQHQELLAANRALRMVSRCQESVIHAGSAETLRETLCRILVEEGGYPLAWVALNAGLAGSALVASELWATPAGRLAAGKGGWLQGMNCHGLAERAREHGAAQSARGEYGFAACLALPLRVGGDIEGVLCVYSNESGVFDEQEHAALQELADNLAFGVQSLRNARKRQAAEQALVYQANHDPTTGLANRTLFNDRLQQATVAAERHGKRVAVLSLTLDRYRIVKSSLGHDACNTLLMHVATALTGCLRQGDTLARLLGNEFAVIVADLGADEEVAPIAAKLLDAVRCPMRWQDQFITTTASIGIALIGKDGADAPAILRSASAAMAHAMGLGGDRFRFYAPEMNERTSRMFALEAELRRALAQQELVVHYQPRAELESGALAGAEALVRWLHPTRGLVPPAEFIPMAESGGLIVPLGAWVIREVCRQQRAWREAGLSPVPVAVNLSPRQFHEEGLVEHIDLSLRENAVSPALLGFEITESTVMDNLDEAVGKLQELKELGIKLSLDDFGTGHSSLSRLRELPIDHLKIDQAFVRKLGGADADEAICRSIIDLGHNLGMRIVAEGVETEQQRAWLKAQRCDEIQGYLYGRRLEAAAFAALLQQEGRRLAPAP